MGKKTWRLVETGIYRKGRLYKARATAQDPYTGKMRDLSRVLEAGSTIQDARAERDALRAEILDQRETVASSVHTIEDYALWWLKQRIDDLAPSSRASYLYPLERLCECMGALPIRDVTRPDLQRWVRWAEDLRRPVPPYRWLAPGPNEPTTKKRRQILAHITADGEAEYLEVLADVPTTRATLDSMIERGELELELEPREPEPYSTNTLRGWWTIIVMLMRDACADGLIERDPTERVRSPKTSVKKVRERRTLSARELGDLVAAAAKVAPQRYAEIALLAYTGCRPGELYGLRWSDIDWAGERVNIEQAVSAGELMDRTKTDAPRETYLPPLVIEALREHLERQMRAGDVGELVFPPAWTVDDDSDGTRTGASLRRAFNLARAEAGITMRISPLVLRRTFDTLLVSAGVDRIILRSMIGHSSEEMTERYAGVRIEDKREAVLRIVDPA